MQLPLSGDDQIAFKERLWRASIELIESRIARTVTSMEAAQAAANAEEKSSAGDKYETSRSMNQLDKEMHSRQLVANRAELAALQQVPVGQVNAFVGPGAVAAFDGRVFFIAAGLGKINFEGVEVYLLSPKAPLAVALNKKQVGDMVVFDRLESRIELLF